MGVGGEGERGGREKEARRACASEVSEEGWHRGAPRVHVVWGAVGRALVRCLGYACAKHTRGGGAAHEG